MESITIESPDSLTREYHAHKGIFGADNCFLVDNKCIATLDPPLEMSINKKIEKLPQVTGHTDGNIILPLGGFLPVACGRMRCAQLRAAQIIAQKQRR